MNQAPESIIMIRPDSFGFNPATAQSNTFQQADNINSHSEISKSAQQEFDHLVNILLKSKIEVIVFDDQKDPILLDAVFPNNWVSFHHDGTVILYPMLAENRRKERRQDILLDLQNKHSFQIDRILDYTNFEVQGRFLEGTGSIVFDYKNKIAYANASPRTDEKVLDKLCNDLGFQKFLFNAVDSNDRAIYHANVMMCIGDEFVVICLDTFPDKAAKEKLLLSFERTGHEVVNISYDQLTQFAGNMIEVLNSNKEQHLIMSQSAYDSLNKEQRDRLGRYAEILYAPIPVIEKYGGGSVRCMIAGNFLPKA